MINRKKKVLDLLIQKKMYSVMNDTKWKELQQAMRNEMPFTPPYQMKLLREDCLESSFYEDVWYLGDWSDEALCWGEYREIEWLKIRPRYLKHQGRLLEAAVIDATKEFIEILENYSIPFEEEDGAYIIYGYKK